MTSKEFQSLSVGDHVEYNNGPDAGVPFQVVFIEDDKNICLRAADGCHFAPTASNSMRKDVKLKVTTYHTIKRCEE